MLKLLGEWKVKIAIIHIYPKKVEKLAFMDGIVDDLTNKNNKVEGFCVSDYSASDVYGLEQKSLPVASKQLVKLFDTIYENTQNGKHILCR